MPKLLILTRHAKSAWNTPASGDHDRPLNDRGRRAAAALGPWLAEHGYHPDAVLSSDAARTRETWSLISQSLPKVETTFLSDLYLAPAQSMLDALRKHGSGQTLLLLGHNPGIANFAQMLARHPATHDRFRDYPTGATTVMTFDAEMWQDVNWGGGTIKDIIVPREL